MPSSLGCRFNCSLSNLNFSVHCALFCALFTHQSFCFSISSVVIGPCICFDFWFLQLNTNQCTSAHTRRVLHKLPLSNSSLNSSYSGIAVARTSLVTFASALDFVEGLTATLGGHSLDSANHGGPFFHSSESVTSAPRLPRSAGLSSVGTWCQITSCWLILDTRFATN